MKHLILSYLLLIASCDANLGRPPVSDMDTMEDVEVDVTMDMDLPPGLGDPCEGPAQCGQDAMCVGTSEGLFICMALCSEAYQICPTGGVCLTLAGRPESVCYTGGNTASGKSCLTNVDCMAGMLCIGAQDQFFCVDACDNATSCGGASYCSTLTSGASVCVRKVGQICESNSDCTPGLMCTSEEEGFLEAVNPGFCTVSSCDAGCPELSMCLTFPNAPESTCVSECETDSDCRFIRGWRCRDKEACASLPDPAMCQTTLGQRSACFPPEIP